MIDWGPTEVNNDPYFDLHGLAPDTMTRGQLARALHAVATGHIKVGAIGLGMLLEAASKRLAEITYTDGVAAERCALCLQRTFAEFGRGKAGQGT